MFAQFAHPVSRVHKLFLTGNLSESSGVSEAMSFMSRHLSSPGMNFLCGKGSFLDGQPLTFIPFENTPYQSPQVLMFHGGSLGRVLPSMKHRQSLSRWYTWTEYAQNKHKVTSHPAKSRQLGTWQMSDTFTHSLREITLVLFDF